MKSRWALFCVLALGGGSGGAVALDQPGGGISPSEYLGEVVEDIPDAGPGEQTVRVLLIAPRQARISSQMQGRIEQLPLDMGDRFNAGDLLVAFACEHQKAEAEAARAELAQARRKLESQRALLPYDAVSDLDVALAETEVERARASLRKSEAALGDCQIRAPYDGRVVRVEANQFEIISPDTVMLEVVESGALRLEALVPSAWLVWLREGHEFILHVDEVDREVHAEVTALSSRVDPVSQTVAIRARLLGEEPELLPGMSGNATFIVPDHDE